MEEAKKIQYPLLYVKTNLVETINKNLKDILISKKQCSNWIYIIKKIIIYSHKKYQNINKITVTNKIIKDKLENTRKLHFLNEYTPFYIKKYL